MWWLKTIEIHFLTGLETEMSKTKVLAALVRPGGCDGKSISYLSPSFWLLSGILGAPWPADASPQSVSVFTWPAPLCLDVFSSSVSYRNMCHQI